MYNKRLNDGKGHGFLRKVKGVKGLASGIALAGTLLVLGGGVEVAHAEEVAETTANPATNFETAQPVTTADETAMQAQAGQSSSAIVTPVETPALDTAVAQATSEGVVVQQGATVVHNTLAEAQADANAQVVAVQQAEAEKVENKEAIAAAEAENARVKSENDAEQARVEQTNQAIDARNEAGQSAVDARNAQAQTEYENSLKTHNDTLKHNEQVRANNVAGQQAVDASNASKREAYEREMAEALARAEENRVHQVQNETAQRQYEVDLASYNQALDAYNQRIADLERKVAAGEGIRTSILTEHKGLVSDFSGYVFQPTSDLTPVVADGYTFQTAIVNDDGTGIVGGKLFEDGYYTVRLNTTSSYDENSKEVVVVLNSITLENLVINTNRPNAAVAKSHTQNWYSPTGQLIHSYTHTGEVVGTETIPINQTYNVGKEVRLTNGSTSSWMVAGIDSPDWIQESPSVVNIQLSYNGDPLDFKRPEPPVPPTPIEIVENVGFPGEPVYDTFTPDPEIPTTSPTPPTPEVFTPEEHITAVLKPYVDVPEEKRVTVAVHPVAVQDAPVITKDVVNANNTNVNNQLVAKGSEVKWVLNGATLKAGREEMVEAVYTDPFPQGFEVNTEQVGTLNPDFFIAYDENGKARAVASPNLLMQINADRTKDFVLPDLFAVGTPTNDGGTYKNTYQLTLRTKSGKSYTTTSNTPVVYTPGNDPKTPRNDGGGEDPTPNDNLINPEKKVIDADGRDVNGKSLTPDSVVNYIATQDFDQYKGLQATKSTIAKNFVYIENPLKGLDAGSMVVNSITAGGKDVRNLLDMHHVLSVDALDDALKAIVKESGVSPVGEFYMWVAKNPQDFFTKYVQQGMDVTYNLSFRTVAGYTGDVENQTFQIDFGNGYYGNIVENHIPVLNAVKSVEQDGTNVNNQVVNLGENATYKIAGWVIPADRGYDLNTYVFVDDFNEGSDEHRAFTVSVNGVEVASSNLVTTYNAQTGLFETGFTKGYLDTLARGTSYAPVLSVTVKRIASGTTTNTAKVRYTVEGEPNTPKEVPTNEVVTTTPEGKVIVHYIEKGTGKTLKDDVLDTPVTKLYTPYDTTDNKPERIVTPDKKTYRIVPASTIGVEKGTVQQETTEVTYVYEEVFGNVLVRYQDEAGNPLIKDPVIDTPWVSTGNTYDTTDNKPKTIVTEDEKTWDIIPSKTKGSETGEVVEGTTEVIYVYREVKGTVTVDYKDEEGNPIKPPVTDTPESSTGTPYDTTDNKPKTIETEDGKTYDLIPNRTIGEENGKVKRGDTRVTYFYKEVKGTVTVNYRDEEGNEIKPPVTDTPESSTGTPYDTTDNKPETIETEDGKTYDIVPEKTEGEENGKVKRGDTLVTYVYKEVKGDVTVEYKDTNGNTIKAPIVDTPESSTGVSYDTTDNRPSVIVAYDEKSGETKIYNFVKHDEGSDSETGKVKRGNTSIVYVYEEIDNLPVKSVKDADGNDINGKDVKMGDILTFELDGAVESDNREGGLWQYDIKDVLDNKVLKLQVDSVKVLAGKYSSIEGISEDTDFVKEGYVSVETKDNTVYIKATEKLLKLMAENEVEDFLDLDVSLKAEVVGYGDIDNTFVQIVNGKEKPSNPTHNHNPEPPAPNTPVPPATVTPVTPQPTLPNTGEENSSMASVGLAMIAGVGLLALAGRKRKEEE